MSDILNIIYAINDIARWFIIAYVVKSIFADKPKRTSLDVKDLIKIEFER